MPKPVSFIDTSLADLRQFPMDARKEAGYQLDKVQHGFDPDDWRPFTAVGPGVKEIRIRDEQGIYRVMYVAKFEEAVYVLHCFQKKTQTTRGKDVELAAQRFRALLVERNK
ncbi:MULTISPECIES: type II toxin-antitoxin system RelE/ParE family toxin [Dryocola]|jgi:phage-related protein|uniref:type II toxin-antitoxin system RelE/ParE family toxin n=1 Tax=Cedecea sulfonylureivorans TaxID=3051154 RepID=UPI0019275CB8|nr:type II toxin-antitoxin system RelE/ParE family toxin [Cedecea sulfonylureivorans]